MPKWAPIAIILGLGAVIAAVIFWRRDDGSPMLFPGLFQGTRTPYAGLGTAACIGGAVAAGVGPGGVPLCAQMGPAFDNLVGPPLTAAGGIATNVVSTGGGIIGDVLSVGSTVVGTATGIAKTGVSAVGSVVSAPLKIVSGGANAVGNFFGGLFS